MIKGYITISEASKKYNRHMTSIRRKIKSREWVENQKRKVNVLIDGEDAFLIGNTWIVKDERLCEIYGKQ